MLKIARKYNITEIAPKYNKETKEEQPLWHNILMNKANYLWNKKTAKCLRNNHKIMTIGDLIRDRDEHKCRAACTRMREKLIKIIPEIINPLKGTPEKIREKNLDHTPKRIKENQQNKNKKNLIQK